MSFGVSPSVTIREIDLTQSVQAAAATAGAFAGKFRWGPVNERVLLTNADQLAARMGTPVTDNAVDFLTASSFLAYTDTLRAVRIGNSTDMNNAADGATAPTVLNDDDYETQQGSLSAHAWIAKYPGDLGNNLAVSICAKSSEYETTLPGSFSVSRGSKTVDYTPSGTENLSEYFNPDDYFVADGDQFAVQNVQFVISVTDTSGFSAGETITGDSTGFTGRIVSIDSATDMTVKVTSGVWVESEAITSSGGGTDTSTTINSQDLILVRLYGGVATPASTSRLWQYGPFFGNAPESGEFHVVVTDDGGGIAGIAGTVLETYGDLSETSGAKYSDGSSKYYVTAINRRSEFIRVGDADVTALNFANKVSYKALSGGVDGFGNFGTDEYLTGYDLFKNPEEVDAPLIIAGEANATVASYLIENIAEVRKDAMVFISPEKTDVVNNSGKEVNDTITFRNSLPSSSYAVLDSGWKYQYDKHNDTYRWVPLNGDIAGLVARTERERDAWFSPAGFQRGRIKNVVKLAWSPSEPQRDSLYQSGINPVTDFPSEGTVLFGDKTLLAGTSAFSRINVRRLFIVVEKAIATASRNSLFEFNDSFTRAQFVSLIEPYLREVKGRRGITDFKVVADESVNTPQVINNNQFVGQVYLKPNMSINFIRLDFVAVRQGVSFDEVVGEF